MIVEIRRYVCVYVCVCVLYVFQLSRQSALNMHMDVDRYRWIHNDGRRFAVKSTCSK